MVYEWKTPLYKVNPQDAGEYLDWLAQRDGGLAPEVIVEEAKDPQAVLHTCFEWNDSQAAQKYREVQARTVIRNLVTVHIAKEEERAPLRTRAFVHIESEPSRYVDIALALADSEMRQNLFEQAKKELRSFQIKYKSLSELAGIWEELDRLL